MWLMEAGEVVPGSVAYLRRLILPVWGLGGECVWWPEDAGEVLIGPEKVSEKGKGHLLCQTGAFGWKQKGSEHCGSVQKVKGKSGRTGRNGGPPGPEALVAEAAGRSCLGPSAEASKLSLPPADHAAQDVKARAYYKEE